MRKDNCLLTTEGRPTGLADDKWKKIDDNVVANMHLALVDSVLLSVVEKKDGQENLECSCQIVQG